MWVFNERHDFGVETDPTQSEFFVNNDIDRSSALVREAVQNSLDARRDDAARVEVCFRLHEGALFLPPDLLDPYTRDLVPHLTACGIVLDDVRLHEPRFLTVEDFGTHGLRGSTESKEPGDFYYFWHVVGRSGKGDTKAGRWGLGKTVFPNSSQLSAFFGYTVRSDDRRHFLLGQTYLKTHEIDGLTFMPYAFYQTSGPRRFELPFEDHEALAEFRKRFELRRAEKPGLSVMVPFPYAEITETALVEAAIEHYFYPILAGRLTVRVNEQSVEAATILVLAARIRSRRLRDIEKSLSFAAEIQHIAPESIQAVDHPENLNSESGRIPADAFTPDHLLRLRQDFRDGRIVGLRIPVVIEPRSMSPQKSFFTVFLKHDPLLFRGHDYYLRGGITLSGQSVFGGRPALGILLADDPPVCRFLGDAENPAHTLWNPRSRRLSAEYHRARETVMFIREAMGGLLDTLTQSAAEEDRHALADIFYTFRPREGRERKRRTEAPTMPEPVPAQQRFQILPIRGGFRLRAGPGLFAAELPLLVTVQVAYEIRRGNPFKKYHPSDFRLDRDPVAIRSEGVAGLRRSDRLLDFRVVSADFDVEVSGFDIHRDLRVRLVERGEEP